MIHNYKEFKQHLKADVTSMGKSQGLKTFLFNPVYRFVYLLRWNEYLVNTKKGMLLRAIPYVWFKRLSVKLGFSIPINTFDAGLAIVHYGLLIVNPNARIGKNCRVHAGVNIGGKAGFVSSLEDAQLNAPVLGDNMYLGPGCKIFGGITIGSGCVIGANAVVNKSFEEDNKTIAGIPAKVISDRGSEGLIIKGASN